MLGPLVQLPLLRFLIRYRRTALGPLWLLVGPSLFIGLLGMLFAEVGASPPQEFIPHLAVGLILWTLVQGFVTGSTTVFQRAHAKILQGGQKLGEVVAIDVVTTVLAFATSCPSSWWCSSSTAWGSRGWRWRVSSVWR